MISCAVKKSSGKLSEPGVLLLFHDHRWMLGTVSSDEFWLFGELVDSGACEGRTSQMDLVFVLSLVI